ncbi:glycosyl hydrolase 115 family protein [Pedobacter faecalis]|uniref:glycosyl hydrolase 115 family protein n=1 Tax=Pedobacter faecalis TaxID=3041495 RepID=UPI00254CF7CA|nr:glycosyl hydrolase 115 family protein [Pedobacter sp. ELA7]
MIIRFLCRWSVLGCLLLCSAPGFAGDIVLDAKVVIFADTASETPINIALKALRRDLKRVLNAEADIRPLAALAGSGMRKGTCIVIRNTAGKVSGLSGWEAHRIRVVRANNNDQVLLEGADTRGTIYAIYSFSEKVLGVPPLWYFCDWKPEVKREIKIKPDFQYQTGAPSVKYRAWFPNDQDLFQPWRRLSPENDELWLETMLRLKLNTVEWFDNERDYAKPYSISRTTKLINDYGFTNTTHHHSPLNASFAGWQNYWEKVRQMKVPELSLSNQAQLEEFWKYNVESIVKNKIDMLWVLGFRGSGDHPFWYTFKDAPESMQERGAIISKMMERQREIVLEVTKDPKAPFRTIFYDELSDLLAKNYITPPADTGFIWTYVAARRDHFPNLDMQQLDDKGNLRLGYYFNYQFTSTGSHLAAAEGPWKMEHNYRYVAGKSNKPVAFSVVNAGNLREHLMELSANAAMMWDFEKYSSDRFVLDFCKTYFGSRYAKDIAGLYKKYYHSYWQQRKSDIPGFERQYIFQDLRYGRALKDLAAAYLKPFQANPLVDISAEQVKNRTFNIVPGDNDANTVLEALLKGVSKSANDFLQVGKESDRIAASLPNEQRVFFADNLQQRAWFMHHLNRTLLELALGYQKNQTSERNAHVRKAIAELRLAESALKKTDQGIFQNWYSNDRVFGFKNIFNKLNALL